MSDPTSTSIGWVNVVADYGVIANGSDQTTLIAQALHDAQFGAPGVAPGSTVYFPPGLYGVRAPFTISQSCAITGILDVAKAPTSGQPPSKPFYGGPTLYVLNTDYSQSVFVITGSDVLISDIDISYPTVLPGTGVAAIQVNSTARVLIRRVRMHNAFSGVSNSGSTDVLCDGVKVDIIPSIPSPSTAFGFMASGAPASPAGKGMACFKCHVQGMESAGGGGEKGLYGFVLGASYPELVVNSCGVQYAEIGCQAAADVVGSAKILRVINVNTEFCDRGTQLDGGGLFQGAAIVADGCGFGLVVSSSFGGAVSLGGSLLVSVGNTGILLGDYVFPFNATPAVSALCGSAVQGAVSVAGNGIFMSLSAAAITSLTGSAIRNIRSAGVNNAAINVWVNSVGQAAIMGIAQTNSSNVANSIGLRFQSADNGTTAVGGCSLDASADTLGTVMIAGAGSTTPNAPHLHDIVGFDPLGAVSPVPPFPTSMGVTVNGYGVDATVYISDTNGNAISDILVNGQSVGLKDSDGPSGRTVVFAVQIPANAQIQISYGNVESGTITWTWIGN